MLTCARIAECPEPREKPIQATRRDHEDSAFSVRGPVAKRPTLPHVVVAPPRYESLAEAQKVRRLERYPTEVPRIDIERSGVILADRQLGIRHHHRDHVGRKRVVLQPEQI